MSPTNVRPSLRRRVIPYPIQSATLLVIWLLLMNSISVGHVLLGSVLGIVVPRLLVAFHPVAPPIRKPLTLLRLLLLVLWDIVVANIQVARQVLGPNRALQPAFVTLPLALDNDLAITMLASIISLTPGTVSADLTRNRRALLIHTLSVEDSDELVRTIKLRYEAPLVEVFGC